MIGRFKTPCSLGWDDRYPNQTYRIAGMRPTESNIKKDSENKKVIISCSECHYGPNGIDSCGLPDKVEDKSAISFECKHVKKLTQVKHKKR